MANQLLTAAMEDLMTWKPISSAPRDGTVILGYSDYVTDECDGVVMWTARYDCVFECFRCVWDGEPLHDITHWRLPEPPKEADDAA